MEKEKCYKFEEMSILKLDESVRLKLADIFVADKYDMVRQEQFADTENNFLKYGNDNGQISYTICDVTIFAGNQYYSDAKSYREIKNREEELRKTLRTEMLKKFGTSYKKVLTGIFRIQEECEISAAQRMIHKKFAELRKEYDIEEQ